MCVLWPNDDFRTPDFKNPRTEAQQEKMRGVVFPGHGMVKTAIQRHHAIILENRIDGCLPCKNGIAKNLQTWWRDQDTGAPPPEPRPSLPDMPHALPTLSGGCEGTQCSDIDCVPPRYVSIHTPLSYAQFFNLNLYAHIGNSFGVTITEICYGH